MIFGANITYLSILIIAINEMIAFSIVLMSRSRSSMFSSLCSSIKNTTLLDYEIIAGLDSDDNDLPNYQNIAKEINNCHLSIDNRIDNLHVRMNNLLRTVSGKYIFVLNDDCLLINRGWDKQAYDRLNSFGDIVYGRTYDNSIDRVDPSYAAFPIVSTLAAKKLGLIMDDTYGNHGADVMTYRIYNEANKVVDLPFVLIDHLLHNSVASLQTRQQDRTATEMIQRTFSKNFNIKDLFSSSVSDKAAKLL